MFLPVGVDNNLVIVVIITMLLNINIFFFNELFKMFSFINFFLYLLELMFEVLSCNLIKKKKKKTQLWYTDILNFIIHCMFSAMRKCKWYLITEGSGWSEGFLYISKYPRVIHINHVPYITTFTADSFSSQEHRPQAQVSFASLIRILSTNNVQTPSRLLACVFDLKRSENLIS